MTPGSYTSKDPNQVEAQRRINQAANLIRGAVRLGGDPEYVASAVRVAVEQGAYEYAEDMVEDYRKATA